MRSILLALMAGLIVVGAVVATRTSLSRIATAPAVSGTPAVTSTAPVPADLGNAIRTYLMANPEVLVEAMQELERKQDSQRDAVAMKAIGQNEAELFRDADSPIGGNPAGDVTIVEFNDYQCPYCKRAHQAVKSVTGADGKVKIIYKDLPILGEPSRIAALAALASMKQGKHQALHNALMEFNGKLDREKILQTAASVGIDVAQLEKDMEDPKLKQIIDRNMALAAALGVRGTPAFVVGKQFVPGAVDAEALKALIADARKS
ncbi:MAG: putative oxidoreductase [Rhodospirillaceae bacterium]|nr:MAG: putative oxidoreductase [Rhodospirillaceae bacterium]